MFRKRTLRERIRKLEKIAKMYQKKIRKRKYKPGDLLEVADWLDYAYQWDPATDHFVMDTFPKGHKILVLEAEKSHLFSDFASNLPNKGFVFPWAPEHTVQVFKGINLTAGNTKWTFIGGGVLGDFGNHLRILSYGSRSLLTEK